MFLNLSADHLDRHASFEAYAQAKARIFANQTADDWAVVNADDPGVLALARAGRARAGAVPSAGAPLAEGAFFDGRRGAACAATGADETLFAARDGAAARRAPGRRTCWPRRPPRACWARPPRRSRAAVRAFRGVEHVLERVAEIGGVALLQRLQGHERGRRAQEPGGLRAARCSSILGGRYKGGDFADAAPRRSRAHGKAVLAIGEARQRIVAARWRDVVPVVRLRLACAEAVERGLRRGARPATPCCSRPPARPSTCSRDYAERGRAFKDEVRAPGERGLAGRRRRAMAKKLSSDTTLFAVTVALLGLGLVMVWSASSALAQEQHGNAYHFLIRQVAVGLPRPRGDGRGHAHRLPQAAPARASSTRRWSSPRCC